MNKFSFFYYIPLLDRKYDVYVSREEFSLIYLRTSLEKYYIIFFNRNFPLKITQYRFRRYSETKIKQYPKLKEKLYE